MHYYDLWYEIDNGRRWERITGDYRTCALALTLRVKSLLDNGAKKIKIVDVLQRGKE